MWTRRDKSDCVKERERETKMKKERERREERSLVKVVLSLVLLDVVLVALLKVLGKDDVAVFPDGLHAGFLADGVDVGAGDLVGSSDKVFQVNFFGKIHLGSDRREDESLLTAVRERKLDFSVESSGSEQGGVEGVCSVGGHDDFDVDGLIEAVHLIEELQEDSLHFSVGAGLSVESLRRDRVDLVDEDDRWRIFFGQSEHVSNHPRSLSEIFLHEFRSTTLMNAAVV